MACSEHRGAGIVTLAAGCFAALYVVLDFNKLHALRFGADSGIFLQTLVNFAHHGSTFNWAEQAPHLQIHDSWTLLAFAPLAALWPRPELLIVLQLALLAGAAIPLYLLARAFGLSQTPAVLIAVAYLISPSVQGWAYSDFSESHLVPILAFALALAVKRRSLWGTLLFAQLLLGVKEDEVWFVGWFALAGALWYDRRSGLAVVALCVANGLAYYGIDALHGHLPNRPQYGLADPFWRQQLAFLAEVLAPFAFAPLALGWRVLLAAPLLGELFLTQHWHYPLARAGVHYTEPIVALLAIGAVIAIARRPRWAGWALACSAIMAAFFNTTVLHLGRHLYAPDPRYGELHALAQSNRAFTFSIDDEGAWVVASGDTNARLLGFGDPLRHPQPAWLDAAGH
ncbi:DUF2079 domain-containing protein [bacterium]|nr:MAG: DUF2079 domain-containing protein [bacterium]